MWAIHIIQVEQKTTAGISLPAMITPAEAMAVLKP